MIHAGKVQYKSKPLAILIFHVSAKRVPRDCICVYVDTKLNVNECKRELWHQSV